MRRLLVVVLLGILIRIVLLLMLRLLDLIIIRLIVLLLRRSGNLSRSRVPHLHVRVSYRIRVR